MSIAARHQETAELVRGEKRASHVRIARHAGVRRVAHDRADEAFGITAAAENVRARKRMLVRRGKHLVVEVVEQPDHSPFIFIGGSVVVSPGTRAHGGFHGQGMLAQAIALRVLTQQLPRFRSIRH